MDAITSWYSALDPTLRGYWTIAIITSIILVIQLAMTFIGIGDADAADGNFDIDTDSNGDTIGAGGIVSLFTIRNIVNFLLGLGWGGVCFWNSLHSHRILLAIVAILTGCCFVALFLFIFRQMKKLEGNGAFQITDCVGEVADVYLRIPEKRKGEGKIQYSFHGSVQELPAITDGDMIPSGAKVRVVELIGDHTLLVEAL